MEDLQLYGSFSRKELQTWCKKLGLPARKSSSVMAHSLLDYFQRNDVHWSMSKTSAGGTFRLKQAPMSSSAPAVQTETTSYPRGNSVADGGGLRSCPRHGNGKGNSPVGSRNLGTDQGLKASNQEGYSGLTNNSVDASLPVFVSQCAGFSVSHKESPVTFNQRFDNIPKYQSIGVTEGTRPSDDDIRFVRGQTSFEFYVASEEGIEICIDLNSRPSDWKNKCNDQVNLFENANSAKSRSVQQNVGCGDESGKQMDRSYLGNLLPGLTVNSFAKGPLQSSVLGNCTRSVVNHPDEGSKSLSPRQSSPHDLLQEASTCLHEVAGVVPLKTNLDVDNGLSCNNVESCDGKGVRSNTDSVVNHAQIEKTASNFGVDYISDGIVDHIAAEHQASKHDHEACDNSVLQDGCFIENGSFTFQNSTACHSTEMLLSKPVNYHEEPCYENGSFIDLVDSQQSLGTDQDVVAYSRSNERCGNYTSTTSEERGWSNNANGPASSVCSEANESVEKTCLMGETAVIDGGHRKKLLRSYEKTESGTGRCDARVLRSAKRSAAVLRRRSTRLVSK